MILRPRLGHLLLSLYLCNTLTSAWPWPPSLPGLDGILVRRQDDKSNTESSSPSASATSSQPSQTSNSKGGTSTGNSAAATTGGSAAASKTTGKGASSTGSSDDNTDDGDEPDPRLPPGGVNMITPSAQATSTYYKIGVDSVSLVWNYTSLEKNPKKIDVLVTCTANQATYTLASNQSFESTGTVVWDTKADETGQSPLLTEKYTLIIKDSDKSVTDRPQAGYLGSFNPPLIFGMYVPQSYTPRSEWKCPTCNDGISDVDRQAIKFMLGMCAVTVLSFTWFVGGIGGLL